MGSHLEQKQRRVKTFDELCGEVCAELRGAGKSIDLCEKMKVFQSDLRRVQVLLMHSPRVVRKFVNCIGDRYEGKRQSEARQLLVLAKSLPTTQCQRAIELLTSALRLSPWRKSEKSGQDEINEFILTQAPDAVCIEWLVKMITATKFGSSSKKTQKGHSAEVSPSPLSSWSKKDENSSVGSSSSLGRLQPDENNENDDNDAQDEDDDDPGTDLLGNIYFERCCRLHQQGSHESAILDCARGVICRSDKDKRKKLAFTTVSAVGASLKGMGHFPEAVLVFNHALQLLRRDNNYDNQAKSTETINIVKALKDIQKITAAAHPSPTTATTKTKTKPLHVQKCPHPKEQQHQQQQHTTDDDDPNHPLPPSQQRKHQNDADKEKGEMEKEKEENSLPHVFGQTHPNLIAASDALDLAYNEHRGRHVVANRTIPPGATLIVDAPYSWSLCPPLYQTLCQHCCKKVASGIPCQHCSSVVFCKWKCWQRSEHYHKFECAILKALDSSEALGEMGLLCYRTVCRTSVRVLEYYASQVESDDKEINNKSTTTTASMANNAERSKQSLTLLGLDLKTNKLDPANFSSVFALTTNAEQRPAGDIIKRTLAAIYLTLCLRYTGYFHHSTFLSSSSSSSSSSSTCSTDTFNEQQKQQPAETASSCSLPKNDFDGHMGNHKDNGGGDDFEGKLSQVEIQTAAFMLRLSQSLSCNAYGINSIVRHSRSEGVSESQPLGGASYPTISIINHSCNPNVFRLTSGSTCIVRSILEIQKGEEIFDSYGPLFTTMPKSERKSLLKSQYFFNCDCEACEENWPLFKDLRTTQPSRVNAETRYKCPGCQKTMEEDSGDGGGHKKEKARKSCSNCGHKIDLRKVAQTLAQSEKNYLAVKDSLLSTGMSSAAGESALAHHLTNLQKFLTPPHKLIVECQETLKLAWNAALLDSQF